MSPVGFEQNTEAQLSLRLETEVEKNVTCHSFWGKGTEEYESGVKRHNLEEKKNKDTEIQQANQVQRFRQSKKLSTNVQRIKKGQKHDQVQNEQENKELWKIDAQKQPVVLLSAAVQWQ